MKMHLLKSTSFAAATAALLAFPMAALAADGDFAPCRDAFIGNALEGTLCATVRAPLDPTLQDGDPVELFVRKFPAQGASRGDVWLVSGGPGEAGASFYPLIDRLRTAFPGYDLLIPDHRGTGRSSRICAAEEAEHSPGGFQLEDAEWATCFGLLNQRSPRSQAFTITNAARDLNLLVNRFSAGRKTIVYGVSYGTQLVLRSRIVADPPPVDSIILDSLIPPETTEVWDLSRRSQVVDQVGRQVLADCDRNADCRHRLGGSAVKALKELEADPQIAAKFPGGRPKLLFGALLNSQDSRALIPDVIAGVRVGDWSKLEEARGRLERFAAPFEAAQAASSIPLVSLISASENTARPNLTKNMVTAEERDLLFTSPLPTQLVGGASLSYPRDADFGVTPRSMPPVLVLQGDMDPKTPYAGARQSLGMRKGAGPVRFVRIKGAPHFVLLTAEACAVREIRAFSSTPTSSKNSTCVE
jgi:pimeloyl-ACP methyl ester carboxylesterase